MKMTYKCHKVCRNCVITQFDNLIINYILICVTVNCVNGKLPAL